ncbi:hypothetical protein PROFUN_09126 [Planoprotostelium fungivorum]|uniref:Peroxisomal biogenesis factor 11 n=1 Tax=Planoprotostelium fungivorum TaxID=1890364 RepID=A0A2P6NI11_9EUKA|nr:hypothetical protein PROFUN_09126 [Planoprotostelium fungivorum]
MSSSQIVAAQDNLNRVVRFMDTTAGRDKIVRLLQYSSRFFGWWLVNNNRLDLAKKFSSIEAHASMARKVFRLFKSIAHLQTAAKTWMQETDTVVSLTTVIQNLSLAIWLYYDHVIWAHKLGLIQRDLAPLSRKSNTFWLIAMLCGIAKATYLIHITQQLAHTTTKADMVESLRKRQSEFSLELVRNLLDLPIPVTSLSPRLAAVFPTGLVGLCGTLSSLIGIHQVWSKIK